MDNQNNNTIKFLVGTVAAALIAETVSTLIGGDRNLVTSLLLIAVLTIPIFELAKNLLVRDRYRLKELQKYLDALTKEALRLDKATSELENMLKYRAMILLKQKQSDNKYIELLKTTLECRNDIFEIRQKIKKLKRELGDFKNQPLNQDYWVQKEKETVKIADILDNADTILMRINQNINYYAIVELDQYLKDDASQTIPLSLETPTHTRLELDDDGEINHSEDDADTPTSQQQSQK